MKTPYAWGKDPDKITVLVPGAQKPEGEEGDALGEGRSHRQRSDRHPARPEDDAGGDESGQRHQQGDLRDCASSSRGNKSPDDPRNGTPGLLKDGDDLANRLHKLAPITDFSQTTPRGWSKLRGSRSRLPFGVPEAQSPLRTRHPSGWGQSSGLWGEAPPWGWSRAPALRRTRQPLGVLEAQIFL